MTVALVVGDTHFSHEPPESRTYAYAGEISDMLGEVREYAKDVEASIVAHVGDHFHRKGRSSHADVVAAAGAYRDLTPDEFDAPVASHRPVLTIPGNHDMIGHNADTVPSQPLGVLVASGVVRLVSETGVVRGGVAVVGVAYSPDCSSAAIRASVLRLIEPLSGYHSVLVLLHHDVRTRDAALTVLGAVSGAVGDRPVVVACGHIHGATDSVSVGKGVFVWTSSIARTSISERDNIPGFWSIVFKAKTLPRCAFVPFRSALPADAAFEKVAEIPGADSSDLDTFVELVGGDGDESVFDPREDVRVVAGEMNAPESHVATAIAYLGGASS